MHYDKVYAKSVWNENFLLLKYSIKPSYITVETK